MRVIDNLAVLCDELASTDIAFVALIDSVTALTGADTATVIEHVPLDGTAALCAVSDLHVPEELRVRITGHAARTRSVMNTEVAEAAAAHLRCTAAELDELSDHPSASVRAAVHANPNCAARTVSCAAHDISTRVRAAAALHGAVPLGVLNEYFARDNSNSVVRAALQNRNCNADTVLAATNTALARTAVDLLLDIAEHPATDVDRLWEIGRCRINRVAAAVVRHPRCTRELADHLADTQLV